MLTFRKMQKKMVWEKRAPQKKRNTVGEKVGRRISARQQDRARREKNRRRVEIGDGFPEAGGPTGLPERA
jgi:hypothetical protein